MKLSTRIAVLFYVIFIMFVCFIILFYVSNFGGKVDFSDIQPILYAFYADPKARLVLLISTIAILFVNYLFYRMFSVNYHKEKVIAFDNPTGRVSVSLTALEDLIKRRLFRMTEINEVKPTISATKKGLAVKLRIVFGSEINIPEVTSKVQDIVKRKVQDTIGLDEPVSVTIYVGKILPSQVKEKGSEPSPSDQTEYKEPNVPFRSYGA